MHPSNRTTIRLLHIFVLISLVMASFAPVAASASTVLPTQPAAIVPTAGENTVPTAGENKIAAQTLPVSVIAQQAVEAAAAPLEKPAFNREPLFQPAPLAQTLVTINGTVFLDYNGDGFRNTDGKNPYGITNVVGSSTADLWPRDPGIAGITVTAYISGAVAPAATTVSSASGAYTLALPSGQSYQIVFSGYQEVGFSEGPHGKSTINGGQVTLATYTGVAPGSTTTTMEPSVGNGFVINNLTTATPTTLRSKLHFGLVHPDLYANVAPRVAWTWGSASSSATSVAAASRPIQSSWTGFTDLNNATSARKELADRSQVGAVWGLAYQNWSDRLFAASVVRRYVAPLSTDLKSDTLFLLNNNRLADPNSNPSAPALLGSVSLSTLGIDTGPLPTRNSTYLDGGDKETFGLVGKRGIGGIDLFTNNYNSVLYLANLYDRQIYGLNVKVPATTTLTAADVVPLPTPPWITKDVCNGKGPARPWAVKVYNGYLYIGLVCTGESAPNTLFYVNAGLNNNTNSWRSDNGLYSAATAKITTLATENYSTCALTDLGGVICWGRDHVGQLGDGTLSTADILKPGRYVAGLTSGVKAIVAGGNHACALTNEGTVKCWGYNNYGQLGDGTTTDRNAPVTVESSPGVPLANVKAISAGSNEHTCAVLNTGGVKCWGYNNYGQVGNGTTTNQSRPVTVETAAGVALTGVQRVEIGYNQTCAILETGGAKCWGYNGYGQLADGTTTSRTRPVDVRDSAAALLSGVTDITAIQYATCFLLNTGEVKCAGYNGLGQLGDNTTTNASYPVFVKTSATTKLTSVAALQTDGQYYHVCAVTTSGGVKCWGYNGYGQLGDGTTTNRSAPVGTQPIAPATVSYAGQPAPYNVARVSQSATLTYTIPIPNGDYDLTAFFYSDKDANLKLSVESQVVSPSLTFATSTALVTSTLASGGAHTCAVTRAGGVKCWGKNDKGQLGDGTTTDRSLVVDVSGLTSGVKALTAGLYYTCALMETGGVKCWGANDQGQLGNGTTSTGATATPVNVSGLTSGVKAIAASQFHTCALLTTGGVKCWGDNQWGQLGDNSVTDRLTPVTVLVAAGTPLSGVSSIAAGGGHFCALLATGGVKCWGLNSNNQLGNNSNTNRLMAVDVLSAVGVPLTGATAVAAGWLHSCAVVNGGARCWGYNGTGQLGNGATTNVWMADVTVSGLASDVISLSAFDSHTCAVLTSGAAKCWGRNTGGQLGDGNTTNRLTPVDVIDLQSGIAAIAPGSHHTCAITTIGGIKCWGTNSNGPLGNGTTVNSYQQIDMPGTTSLSVLANTQSVHTQNVTVSDGKLDLLINRTSGLAQTAFLSGLILRTKFTGSALVYAYPLSEAGRPLEASDTVTYTLPISFSLGYARSAQIDSDACSPAGLGTRAPATWNAWADSYNDAWHVTAPANNTCGPAGRRLTAYPQPMLVDIEFGPSGNIALGFADRFGYQMKYAGDYAGASTSTTYYKTQPHPPGSADTTGTGYYSPAYAGDLLCASGSSDAPTNRAWTIESGGLCAGRTSAAGITNSGSAREFFADSFQQINSTNRWEPARGTFYQIPGAQSLAINTNYLKNTSNEQSAGASTYAWANGLKLRDQYGLSYANTASTDVAFETGGNHIHDFELLAVPAPVEIGDRVWNDLNSNGLQDPGEPGLAGVVVKLSDATGKTAQATTDAAGYFLFSSDPDPIPTGVRDDNSNVATGSRVYGLDGKSTGEINLLPVAGGNFTLTINLNQAALSPNGLPLLPTLAQATTNNPPSNAGNKDNDPRDSDGLLEESGITQVSLINFSIGNPGANDSAFDFGFTLPTLKMGNLVWLDSNNNSKVDAGEPGIPGVTLELYYDSNKDYIYSPGKDKFVQTTTTDANGIYTFTNLANSNYVVLIPATNFASGGALLNKTPSFQIRVPAADGDSDRNNSSHTRREGFLGSGGYAYANVIKLEAGREPKATIDGDDIYGNQTIDFGFINATTCATNDGDVGGYVFIDDDFNGFLGAAESLLPNAALVTAYDSANRVVMTATVGLDGRYLLPKLFASRSATETLRYEFTNLLADYGTGPDGSYAISASGVITGSGTSVQFRSGPSCTTNYGVTDLYTSACINPYLAQCAMYGGSYAQGNPLAAGSTAAKSDNVVSWKYGATGYRTGNYLAEAKGANVGSVWGMAADRPQGRILVSALVKRTVQMGSLGIGGIYRMFVRGDDTPEPFIDLTSLGINLGTIPSNAVRSAQYEDPMEIAIKVARTGIGDIDLDEKGRTLWVTNLFEKKLIAINVTRKSAIGGSNPVRASDIILQTAIPMPACTGGQGRPWGIAVRDSYVYAGVVCDASVSLNRHHLQGYIYRLNTKTKQWDPTPLLQFPLDYRKANLSPDATVTVAGETDAGDSYFQPWSDAMVSIRTYIQPLLADIEFDDDGSLIVQIIDRSAHQRSPHTKNAPYFATGGDTLRFCLVDGAFIAQGNAGCPLKKANGQGLNGGQYYWGVYASPFHFNTQNAGLAVMPGTREVVVGMMDPDNWIFQQGAGYISSLTGAGRPNQAGYVLQRSSDPGNMGKGSGVGDIEILCEPAPLEIGNRIWLDPDINGIQDTDEQPFAGVVVRLYRAGKDGQFNTADDLLVATTTTNVRGEYIFNDKTDGNADRDIYAETGYQVRVDTTQAILKPYLLTKYNGLVTLPKGVTPAFEEPSNNYGDLRDSDAYMVGSNAVISLTTSLYRDNNHTYDIGFFPTATLGNQVWYDYNGDGLRNEPTIDGVPGIPVFLYDVNGTVVATTTTDARGYYTFTNLLPNTYTVGFDMPAGYEISPKVEGGSTIYTTTQRTDPIGLAVGETNLTRDAGLIFTGGLGDRIWNDLDGDGVQDAGEPGIPGVLITLTDAAGHLITTTTNSSGLYNFPDLDPGTYTVTVTPPPGYTVSPQNQGGVEPADSDLNPVTKQMTYTLGANESYPHLDGGLYQPVSVGNYVWYDNDADGIQDTSETGVAGVVATLYNATTGQPYLVNGKALTTTTDANGQYLFSNLPPGNYVVQFNLNTLPAGGYVVTTPDADTTDTTDSDANPTGRTTATGFLPSGSQNLTLDMGIYRPASLGDRVWNDRDGDGIQDAGETGLAGVPVVLYDAITNTPILTTTTDANGNYSFTNLKPGAYYVEFTPPAGYVVSPLDASGNVSDTVDSDVNPVTLRTAVTTLAAGENDPTWDMGIYQPVKVGDQVWLDSDGDGIQDAGESSVAGVLAMLYDTLTGKPFLVDGKPLTATTDANGNYLFDNLPPGNYYVKFDLNTLPAGYAVTKQNQGTNDGVDSDADRFTGQTAPTGFLAGGSQNLTLDMGIFPVAGLGNYVWYDDNQDGIQDANELGVTGIVVQLYDVSNTVIATTTTDASGYYSFTNLFPGIYSVGFVKPTGYNFSPQDALYDDDGDPNTADVNDNTLDSDANTTTGRTAPVTLAAGEFNPTLDAGLVFTGGLGDRIWSDRDADGIQDAGEPGIAGISVTLTKPDGSVITTTTDATGFYSFPNLPAGSYTVTVKVPAGYAVSPQNAGTQEAADSDLNPVTRQMVYTLGANESYPHLDAGLYQPVRVGDRVWYDDDADGVQDAGETGVAGVVMTLYDVTTGQPYLVNGKALTTTTDANGNYLFDKLLPGNYFVQFDLTTLPPGYVVTAQDMAPGGLPNDGADSDAAPTTGATAATGFLAGGNQNLTLDMGIYKPVRVGDYVWYDTDADGLQDSSETSVAGVVATLYNATTGQPYLVNGQPLTVTTDASGHYLFDNLPPGNYFVQFDLTTLPAGYLVSPLNASNNLSDTVDSDANPTTGRTAPTGFLPSGSANLTLDLGIYQPASLGDRVWYDSDADGIQDAGEAGVAGVTVVLYDALTNQPLLTTTTDMSGTYAFTNLTPGSYYVGFTPPAGYSLSPQDAGSNDTVDSDANPVTYRTAVTTLVSGENDPTWDAGLYEPVTVGDRVWYDDDADGTQDPGESGVVGVVATLYDATTGQPLLVNGKALTTTTDASGLYTFTALPPGNYYVQFDLTTLPARYVVSPKDAGSDDAADSDANALTGQTAPTGFLPGGSQNLTLDLGIYQPASLGDRVWYDLDADGLQDAGESGFAGVQVVLYDEVTNTPLLTTTTDANGNYTFTNLVPGAYYVGFTPPAGYVLSSLNASNNLSDTLDSDADPVTYKTAVTTLVSGENDPTWDAGMYELVTVGDRVWYDTDADGRQDASELGVAGVVATLYDATIGQPVLVNGQPLTDTTDASGFYRFDNLPPGNYYVKFDLTTLPGGYAVTPQNAGSDDASDSDANATTGQTAPTGFLPGGSQNLTLDLGIYPLASLGDRVWYDSDGDGFQDASETGVSGVQVVLYDAVTNTPLLTTTTNATGNYTFTNLAPGEYYVVFTPPAGYAISPQDSGSDNNADSDANPLTGRTATTTLTAGENDLSWDLGLYQPVQVGDYVWNDTDVDGVQDATESGVAGVVATLYDAVTNLPVLLNGQPVTVTTDANGVYLFDGLPPGNYYVQFDLTTLPDGYVVTFANTGSDSSDSDADRTTGRTPATGFLPGGSANLTLDMGIYQPASLGNLVWYDTNGNGLQDEANLLGVPGVPVTLYDVNGTVVATNTTDANGYYTFTNLVPTTYTVGFAVPTGYGISPANQGSDDAADSDINPLTQRTQPVSLQPGENNPTLDAGIYFLGSLGDRIWEDLNANGIQDAGEPGIPGVTLTLYRDGAPIGTIQTDVSGFYSFTDLDPSVYTVTVTPPAGYTVSPQHAGTLKAADSDLDPTTLSMSHNLLPGEKYPHLDGGFYRPVTVGDYVWYDTDADGIQDVSEQGVAGVVAIIYNATTGQPVLVNGQPLTDTTDASGLYLFAGLPPGNYYVQFDLTTLPPGYLVSPLNASSNLSDTVDSDANPTTGRTAPTGFLPSGSQNLTLDLGIYQPASLGDRVWYDADADGVQDVGEAGVAGVTVVLYDAVTNTPLLTTTTDAKGNYTFTNLTPGSYYVGFTPPAGYSLSPQDAGSNDAADSDADPVTYRTAVTTLISGENDPTWDAGLYEPVTVGDYVWYDTDADGIQDAGETGVAGVVATLYDATTGQPVLLNGQSLTTTTDANGLYLFANLLPGNYYVKFDLTTLPAGYVISPANAGSDDAKDSDANGTTGQTAPTGFLPGGSQNLTLDLGIYQPASLGDHVWYDSDADGIQDAGESGIAGVTAVLYDAVTNTPLLTTTTDANGNYSFTNLVPGSYYVGFTPPAGYLLSPQNTGGDDAVDSDVDPVTYKTAVTTLVSGENDPTWDAGLYELVTVGDRVWYDTDADGRQDAGETGVSGVVALLYDATTGQPVLVNGHPLTTTTDASGFYRFDNLPPGNYYVKFDLTTLPGGYAVSPANTGSDDTADSDANATTGQTTPTGFLPGGSQNLTLDLGIYQPASLGDRVWYDSDGDGFQDASETGVSGVQVVLYDAVTNTPLLTTTTNATGNYTFTNLTPGEYYVQFTPPAGYVISPQDAALNDGLDSDANPLTGRTATTTLTAGENDLSWDLGIYQPVKVGDYVWNDTDVDGVQDATESGVAGVVATLYDAVTNLPVLVTGQPLTVTTDANGHYLFENLPPGNYYVVFDLATLPDGYIPTPPDQGGDDASDSDANRLTGRTAATGFLPGGSENLTLDLGIYQPASLGNYVWYDTNVNGVQDETNITGVPGIVVTLYDVNGTVVATTTTDATGYYSFTNLIPSTYKVGFTMPTGYGISPPYQGGDDRLDSNIDPVTQRTAPVALQPGENNPTLDAGIYFLGSLGDRVWEDLNGNGVQDAGEPGVPGLTVTLYHDGVAIGTVQTDATGFYSFTSLTEGLYTVTVSLPAGYLVSPQNAGTLEAADSDLNPVTHAMSYVLSPGEAYPHLDAGIYRPVTVGDYVWYDNDRDGLQDSSETGVPGVVVTLYDATTNRPVLLNGAVLTDVTAANGNYLFDNLPPGNYYVLFDLATLPAGALVTTPNIGQDDALDSDVGPITGRTAATGFLPSGSADLTLDMGIYLPVPPASLGDYVWFDTDADGIQDVGEEGVAGVEVVLYDAFGNEIASMVTDASGFYQFTNLEPGDYYVQFNPPVGYVMSPPDQGGNNALDSDVNPLTGRTVVTTLSPGENDPTWDLGLYQPVGLGDRVWYDLDRNGVQDAGESGVAGVTVELLDSQGNVLSTTTTSATGYYNFSNLEPGIYSIRFVTSTLPGGYLITAPNQGSDAADSDADPTTGQTTQTTLAAGEFDPTWDMGIYLPPASLGDYVWADLNHDGIQDAGEPGIAGVLVSLTMPNGTVLTTTTDANGAYSFTNLLPGVPYTVTFTPPAGYLPTLVNNGSDSSDSDGWVMPVAPLQPGQHNPTIDSGFWQPASLGDRVWYDTNRDGVQDAGEAGVAGVTVELLDSNGNVLGTTTTDATGYYSFTNLAPGSYAIHFMTSTLPSGYVITGQDAGSDDTTDSDADPLTGRTILIDLAPGEHDPTWDMGIYQPTAGLGDYVWYDLDRDGVQDAGESGVAGVTVALLDSNGNVLSTTTTSATGYYSFMDLEPVVYSIRFVTSTLPTGYLISPVDQGSNNGIDSDANPVTGQTTSITLPAGTFDRTWDMGIYLPLASLGDYVWSDLNHDGVQDTNEPGIAGVVVSLTMPDGTVRTTTTNASGAYTFTNLMPRVPFTVTFTPPAGYLPTLVNNGSDSSDSDGWVVPVAPLQPGQHNPTIDSGFWQPASLGDRVWYDLNRNGVQDGAELGVAGVTVQLLDSTGNVLGSTATNASGYYSFTNLIPGVYSIRFVTSTLPAGYVITGQDAGSDNAADSDANSTTGQTASIDLAPGEHDPTWDMGIYPPPAAIGDRVWLDTNKDGLQDASERGVAGVTVQLYTSAGVKVAEVQTDANGDYLFTNLPSGDYYVQFIPPAGYLITKQDASGANGNDQSANGGSDDSDVDPATGRTVVTTLGIGETDRTWDLGLYLPDQPASIGDRVWFDTNKDGIQGTNESGVAGVTVNLYNSQGDLVATTTTDANGYYHFGNLQPGDYSVEFKPPAGYLISPQDAGGDDTADSDADPRTGKTVPTTLVAGENDLTWDLGLYLPEPPAALGDYVWYDTNRNGVQDGGESGVPGVTVQLYSATGELLATTQTDATGYYLFDNLQPGDYYVKFIPPAGYQFSPANTIADFADSDADRMTGQTALINLSAGEIDPTVDAGIFLPTPPASIGNYVWLDTDKDGRQDADEPGVPGVTVQLYRADGTLVATLVTGADGEYEFTNLAPGDYYVQFTPPIGYGLTTPDASGATGNDQNANGGADDSDVNPATGRTVVTNLVAGENDSTWDLGLTLPTPPASLGDYVWLDLNGNGLQETGEAPIAGVLVTLYRADGTLLGTTTTDENGYYIFAGLTPGSYYVKFTPPAGYAPTPAHGGSNDAIDSDADPTTGRTPTVTLAAGEHNPTLDAGYTPLLSLGNLIFNDARNNGIFDPEVDLGIDGVVVNLYRINPDGTETLIASTVTADGGYYLFTDLLPGDYVVELAASNFGSGGLLSQFVSSLSTKNVAGEPQVDPDNDVNHDDNGFGVTLPDGSRVIRTQPVTLAYGTEPTNDGDRNTWSNLRWTWVSTIQPWVT